MTDDLKHFADVSGRYYAEAHKLLVDKQADYGPTNIAAFGLPGLVVRLTDKLARLQTLVWSDREPECESVADTLVDMANYALIGRMVQEDAWPLPAPKSLRDLGA